jgi:hypothetical protein
MTWIGRHKTFEEYIDASRKASRYWHDLGAPVRVANILINLGIYNVEELRASKLTAWEWRTTPNCGKVSFAFIDKLAGFPITKGNDSAERWRPMEQLDELKHDGYEILERHEKDREGVMHVMQVGWRHYP